MDIVDEDNLVTSSLEYVKVNFSTRSYTTNASRRRQGHGMLHSQYRPVRNLWHKVGPPDHKKHVQL